MANTKYGVVETSKINATYLGGGHIFSVVDDAAAMENGMIVALGDQVEMKNIKQLHLQKVVRLF